MTNKYDKLIELLNEWLPTSCLYDIYDKMYYTEYCGWDVIKIMAKIRDKYKPHWDRDGDFTHLICLKQYEFIKWLLYNNKITSDWIKPRDKLVKEITILDQDGNAIWWDNKYTEEEQLLMYLSIQDNPIEFLISILK